MTLGTFIIEIIKQLGTKDIFGVPGDYNLRFLDYIVEEKSLRWIGNCNELNASYATDGYAREKGIGVLVTTLGVGELSAANGIAGSYAHNIPILHIVGYPNTQVLDNDVPVHHTLANFQRNSFLESFRSISEATTILTENNYLHEIQRIVLAMLISKKPVYLGIPTNLVDMEISETIEDISFYTESGNCHDIKEVGDTIIRRYLDAKRPLFFLGINVARFGWRSKMTEILQKTQAKFATTLMGKSIINETSVAEPNYLGLYAGDYSTEGMVEIVQNSDCIISIGTVETDLNSGGFSEDGINPEHIITFRPKNVKIGKKLYAGINILALLEYIYKNIQPNTRSETRSIPLTQAVDTARFRTLHEKLNHKDFWPLLTQEVIQRGDIVVAEAGSSLFGLLQQNLPPEIDFVSQILWASIGYTLPSAIGAAIASPERRVLLFIGDGSFQLTAQELCLIQRYDLNLTVFLVNNDGYTIERAIHGEAQSYNDISRWKYQDFAKSLGIETCLEVHHFSDFVKQIDTINAVGGKFVELFFDALDYPPLLKQISDKLEEANRS